MQYALLLLAVLAVAGCGSAPPQSPADVRRDRMVETGDRAQRAVARGELERAAMLYAEALRQAESIEDFGATGLYALNLAAVRQALGEADAADRALAKVLDAPRRHDGARLAEAAGRRAQLALDAGRLDATEAWLERAERECGAPACGARTALLGLRGRLVLERGSAEEARQYAKRALDASRADANREEEANALRLDGRAAARLGHAGEAEKQLNQALDIDKELALPRKIAQDLLELAEAALLRGDRAVASEYGDRALEVSRAAGVRPQQEAARRLMEKLR